MRTIYPTLILLLVMVPGTPASAQLYSYENEEGDYVISKQRPKDVGEYAILSDDGEFIEMVRPPAINVPISHWRPWYLPREPNPLDGVQPDQLPEGTVTIEEVDEPAN